MNILVTGSSKGIGEGIARKFLSMGHTVVGFDIAQASIEDSNFTHMNIDVFNDELPDLPHFNVIINNAGVQNSADDIDINLKGTIRVTEKYAFHSDIKSVLFIASASAQTGAEFPMYAASKGGMVAYMKNVALRIAEYGATSNSLSPGGVITDLNKHVMEDEHLWQLIMNETLIPKWATIEEIADWTYFVTMINKSMTAQDILIDNGEAAKSNFIW